MAMTTDTWPAAPVSTLAVRLARRDPTVLVAVLAAALTFSTLGTQLLAVLREGAFFDTDDAMRLVEVRAFLHGQAWYDMTARGLDPPHGIFMHWSRVVDVPLAALIRLFGLFADPAMAERLARLAFPFGCLVGLYLAMACLASVLLGPSARLPAIGATLLSGNGIAQFVPGRIHHSVPQVVILAAMVGFAVASLEPARHRLAAAAGLLAALSLSISLELLPFVVTLTAALALVWVWHGAAMDRMLGAYACGLGVGLPLTFLATVAPSRALLPVCDAYGAAHLGVGLVFALTAGIVAVRGAPAGRVRRLAMMVAIAALATAYVALAYPGCLHDPYAGVDPLVREIWLSHVEEAQPFHRLLTQEPDIAWPTILPVVLGLGGCLLAAWRETSLARTRFLVVAAIVATGLAMGLWQVRVFTSVTAIALCGGLWVAVTAMRWCRRRGRDSLATLSVVLVFPFTASATSMARAAVSAPSAQVAAKTSLPSADACLTPAALAPLRELPSGATIAPIDSGSYLLAETQLTVFAAAYHRDNDGIRFMLDLMSATPSVAHALASAREVAYVVICPTSSEIWRLAARNPASVAAVLLADRPPGWLERVEAAPTPYAIYRVRLGT